MQISSQEIVKFRAKYCPILRRIEATYHCLTISLFGWNTAASGEERVYRHENSFFVEE